jgi:hypothetical protein
MAQQDLPPVATPTAQGGAAKASEHFVRAGTMGMRPMIALPSYVLRTGAE